MRLSQAKHSHPPAIAPYTAIATLLNPPAYAHFVPLNTGLIRNNLITHNGCVDNRLENHPLGMSGAAVNRLVVGSNPTPGA